MTFQRLAWAAWTLAPVAGLAIYFGPGQQALTQEKAMTMLAQAGALEAAAQDAQDAAHQKHLDWLHARRLATESRVPADARAAQLAADEADQAYVEASKAWQATADQFQGAGALFEAIDSPRTDVVAVARARALIRSGELTAGVRDLEGWLAEAIDQGLGDSELARQARAEIAAGYYYGARLMRQAGEPTPDWTKVASLARQNFRYLAETETDAGTTAAAPGQEQLNLEVALNLERSVEDLTATPLPRNSPQKGNTKGLRDGMGKGKTRTPPRGKDGRGAGGTDEIPNGW